MTVYEFPLHNTCISTGTDPWFCVSGSGDRLQGPGGMKPPRSWQVFRIIEAFLAATLKRYKDVMNFIRTMIFLKYKIKVVYHIQMGQDNNLVERHSLSSEFQMLKWSNIYGFGNINLSLDCLIFSGKRGGIHQLCPPLDLQLISVYTLMPTSPD